ncbi:uncharacterized protein LOC104898648 [Beta vulgaris subsp. vulgaris]|uniref:uncharacterized protein LOC104898648 n=1 Tax=Beta vulgaris subsp. vulgaris TaxID=3555 RepID=UPI002036BC2E|nr:uncharacterized protein LOC104898648 [Beta vulgaris subsp. vulgaris]
MARALTLTLPLPHIQSQNLNHLFSTQPIIISSNWSWTRNSSSKFCNSKSNYMNDVYIIIRGLTSFSATSLPSLSYNHLPLRSKCDCFRFSSLSLFPLRRSRASSLWFSVMSSIDEHAPIVQDSTKTIRCMIKGRVQGVFYRNWTIENATQLGLKGWVRNRRDGSVEALFSGKAVAVDEMLQRCRRGPPEAMVTALEANPSDEDPGVGFERKHTV